MADNYTLSRDRAQAYFLGFDQQQLIRAWNLKHDENQLYVTFLGRPYGICRRSGRITRLWSGQQAGFEEVLSIFDFLCHCGEEKRLSGKFAPVNSLQGTPRTGGVGTDFHSKIADRFEQNPEAFRSACLALGGTPVDMGDMGFWFPVFDRVSVILKFYRADEDFPASLTLLWDDRTLDFIFYETVFYVAGFLCHCILEKMKGEQ